MAGKLATNVGKLQETLHDTPYVGLVEKLPKAKGLAFLEVYRLGCIVTVRGANGCIVLRKDDGKWSAPMALSFGGIALGADIGIERTQFVILFHDRETAISFCEGNSLASLNGCLTLGPLGRTGEAFVNTQTNEAITSVATSNGIYGGVSLEFSNVQPDRKANRSYYDTDRVSVDSILDGSIEPPKDFQKLYKRLGDFEDTALLSVDVKNKQNQIPSNEVETKEEDDQPSSTNQPNETKEKSDIETRRGLEEEKVAIEQS